MAIRVVQDGKPAVEIVATRGFMDELSDAEQQEVFKRWTAVLDCAHQWEPATDGEERCRRCAQKRVPSIEATPGLVVIEVRPSVKVWAKKDEFPACTCEPCKQQMLTSEFKGAVGAIHAEQCGCDCEKGRLDLWTFMNPSEH